MKVTCDVCKNEFDAIIKEKTKTIDGHEIIRTYMKCQSCGAEYGICYDDTGTLALKKEIKKQTHRLKGLTGNKYLSSFRKLRKKQKQLEFAMNKLQFEYNNEKEN